MRGIIEEEVIEPAMETNELGQEVRVDRFERFRIGGAYYAYIRAPVDLLNVQIPEGVAGSSLVVSQAEHDEEGNETKAAVTRQKFIGEFILNVTSVPDSQDVVGTLSWMEKPICRTKPTPRYEMVNWETFLHSYGFEVDSWLTLSEMQEALIAKTKEIDEI